MACYFAGLGLGALLARRGSRRPVRLYGWLELLHVDPHSETIRALAEGPAGIVSVVEKDGDLQLRLDNYYVLGESAAAANERRLGFVPLLLHPYPRRVAFVGLATGITASAASALEVNETIVIEVVPEVAAAARTHFAAWNAGLLDRPDTRLIIDDGRRYLAATPDRFDVIVSDLFIPWHAETGNLYAREMYDLVARRLMPGGLFCQWLPLYQLTREEFDIIVHTFLAVFPQVSLWRDDFYPNRPVVGLVGQLTPRPLDLTQVDERLLRLPDWSRDSRLTSWRGLVMLYAGNLTAATDMFAAAPLNTDNHPVIEFLAPQLTRIAASGDKDWFTGEALAMFYDTLASGLTGATDPLLPASDEVTSTRRAGTALYRYVLASSQHDDTAAAGFEAEVRTLVPEIILAAGVGDPESSLATARQELERLRTEQEQVRRHLEDVERRLKESVASGAMKQ